MPTLPTQVTDLTGLSPKELRERLLSLGDGNRIIALPPHARWEEAEGVPDIRAIGGKPTPGAGPDMPLLLTSKVGSEHFYRALPTPQSQSQCASARAGGTVYVVGPSDGAVARAKRAAPGADKLAQTHQRLLGDGSASTLGTAPTRENSAGVTAFMVVAHGEERDGQGYIPLMGGSELTAPALGEIIEANARDGFPLRLLIVNSCGQFAYYQGLLQDLAQKGALHPHFGGVIFAGDPLQVAVVPFVEGFLASAKEDPFFLNAVQAGRRAIAEKARNEDGEPLTDSGKEVAQAVAFAFSPFARLALAPKYRKTEENLASLGSYAKEMYYSEAQRQKEEEARQREQREKERFQYLLDLWKQMEAEKLTDSSASAPKEG